MTILTLTNGGVLTTVQPGFVDQTNAEYHGGPGTSKSDLSLFAQSPLHWWHAKRNPERVAEEQTAALLVGSACHAAVLEPDLFTAEYASIPEDAPRRPTDRQVNAKKPSGDTLEAIAWWRDFETANTGKELLTPDQFATALAVRDAVYRHPIARTLFTGGRAEQSVHAVDTETGEHIKCRFDYLSGMAVDLKTCEDASPDGFGRDAFVLDYFLQPPWYFDVMASAFGEAPPWWVFVAVEKKPPYAIGIYYATPDQIDLGRRRCRQLFKRLVAAKRLDHWPSYSDHEVRQLELPAWGVKQIENSLSSNPE